MNTNELMEKTRELLAKSAPGPRVCFEDGLDETDSNAELVAHLCTANPVLLEVLDALTAERDWLALALKQARPFFRLYNGLGDEVFVETDPFYARVSDVPELAEYLLKAIIREKAEIGEGAI